MFNITTLESLFWMSSAFFLMLVALHFSHKVSDLQSQLNSSKHFSELFHATIVDMGFQLFNLNRRNSTNRHHPGYVYVVKSDSGHYKIGHTTDPKQRSKTFGVKLPMEIEFLVLIQTGNCSGLENFLHTQYEHKHVNGEWFDLSDTDLLWLKNFPGNSIN